MQGIVRHEGHDGEAVSDDESDGQLFVATFVEKQMTHALIVLNDGDFGVLAHERLEWAYERASYACANYIKGPPATG